MEQIGANLSFGGQQLRFRHSSDVLKCDMTFSVYLPPQSDDAMVPVLYWLSGLTCTDENFVTKAGAQRYAAEHGVAIVAPDTSPRGEGAPTRRAREPADTYRPSTAARRAARRACTSSRRR